MTTISHKSNLIAALATERDRFFDELSKVGAGETAVQGDMLLPANVEFSGTPAALSPEAPLERRVGGNAT